MIAAAAVLGLIVSIGMVLIAAHLLWQTPAAPTQAELSLHRQAPPETHLAFHIQGVDVKRGDRRHEAAGGEEDELAEVQTTRLTLPSNPQVQQIILEAPPLLPPFPTEHNVAAGTPRARLIRAFGKPDLKARTVQQERLIETYIYEEQDRATLIQIEDGSVVSAHTGQPQRIRVLSSEPEPED